MKLAPCLRPEIPHSGRAFALAQVAAVLAAALLLDLPLVFAQEQDLPAPQSDAAQQVFAEQLKTAAAAAEGKFRPAPQEEVVQTLRTAQERMEELQKFLAQDPKQSAAWNEYLLLPECTRELSAPAPQVVPIEKTRKRLDSGFAGLELEPFTRLESALGELLVGLRLLYDPQAAENYAQKLKQVVDAHEAFSTSEDAQARRDFAEAVLWLRQRNQAPELTALCVEQFDQPNLHVQMSAEMIARGMSERINRLKPVRDYILGTSIRGTGQAEGEVTVQFIPNEKYALLEAVSSGAVFSRTVGYNGPVRIYSLGTTPFHARTRLIVDERGLRASGSEVAARTSTKTTGVGTRKKLFSRVIRHFAWKKIHQQQGQANAIASQHARRDLKTELDAEFAKEVKDANANYHKRLLFPLRRSGAFPRLTRFSTTRQWLQMRGTEAQHGQLATTLAPPQLDPGAWLAVRVHETMAENLMASAVAGETLTDEQLRTETAQILGQVPKALEAKEGAQPWSLTFAEMQPVSVTFHDEALSVVIRGSRYTSGASVYGAMNIMADYEFSREGSTVLGKRTKLEALPPDFDPNSGRLGAKTASLRRQLIERFDEVFPQEIKIDQIEPEGELAKVGTLVPQQFGSSGSWLTISFVPQP